MEVQLLQEAIAEYRQSLESVAEGLEASPDEAELIDLKQQLEAALSEAEAALEGLQQPEQQQGNEQQQAQPEAGGSDAQPAGPQAEAAQQPATILRAAPAISAAHNNARIHPRNKYAFEEPDFAALAALYPSLAPHLLRPSGNGGRSAGPSPAAGSSAGGSQPGSPARAVVDFSSPAACRELTRVLLRHDFGVEWWVPLGQLVPPLTNRANYIHWLEDLLALSAPPGPVHGLDIGCGANLIYPLLGATLAGWSMVGADCTPAALEWAARNLGANPQLAELVELRAVGMQPEQQRYLTQAAGSKGSSGQGGGAGKQTAAAPAAQAAADAAEEAVAAEALAEAPAVATARPAAVLRLSAGEAVGSGIVSSAVRRGERFAFCMCNPPFFESLEEAGRNPATAYGGTAPEMVYPGGELAFVSGMVQDSLHLRGAVHWYTTMVGKKATLRAVRSLLYRHGVRVLRTTEFFQGKTSRWALAWSFVADASAASQPLPRFPAAGAAGRSEGQAAAAAGQRPAAARPPSRKLSWQVHAPPGAGPALLDAVQRCLQAAGVQCSLDRGSYSARGSYTPSVEELAAAAADDAAVPAAKRPRSDPGDGAGVGALAAGSDSSVSWAVELRLFQQHPGLFMLTAALPPGTPDGALAWFGGLTQQLQRALAERWKVGA